MPATRAELFARFNRLGIRTETREHAPVFTVEEARALRGEIPGGHCKNLFLKDERGAIWLIVCLEEARIDLKALPAKIGSKRLTFGKPDLLMEVLGVEPGSVTPFGLMNDSAVRANVILDKTMMDEDLLNYHPLSNDATTTIRTADLSSFIRSCGHQPRIVAVSLGGYCKCRPVAPFIGLNARKIAMDSIIGGPATRPGNGAAPPGELIKDSDTKRFMADVIEASRKQPVIVDFWAPWCGPCKQLGPALEKAVKEASGKVRLVKVNVDENQQLAAQMRVQSIPAVFAFVNGQPVDGFMGALPESQLKQFIARLSGEGGMAEEIEAAVTAGREALVQQDYQTAAQIFAQAVQADREHAGAIAGLARTHVATGDLDNAKATLALVPPAKSNDPDVVGARAALELALNPVDRSAMAELQKTVDKEPENFQARLDLAAALNSAGQKSEAVDHLLYIIRKNRGWNEEAARKQLVRFFEAWGPKDEVTLQGRRKLSSILFA